MIRNTPSLLVLALCLQAGLAFTSLKTSSSCLQQAGFKSKPLFAVLDAPGPGDDDKSKKENKKNSDDFVPAEELSAEYTGSVDWDAEWKKVMKNKEAIKSENRPGKDFYKSDAEIAAIRAANQATEKAARLAAKVPSIPSWQVLKGDWRFWVVVLASLSVASSLISAAATQNAMLPSNSDPGSYYI